MLLILDGTSGLTTPGLTNTGTEMKHMPTELWLTDK